MLPIDLKETTTVMYTFSSKLKTFSLVLMILGIVGFVYGYMTIPHTEEQVQAYLTSEVHGSGHGGSEMASHGENDHDREHIAHVLHQFHNKPWAAFYVAAFFFMMISLGVLAFYAIQRAAQAGWSPVLFRVMESISSFLPWGLFFVLIVLISSSFHIGGNHLFHWMDSSLFDPSDKHYDKLIANKQGWLNVPFFLARAFIYSILWVGYWYISRRFSLAQDTSEDTKNHVKNFRFSAAFLVVYLVTESMMSWDWIMGVDPHWFSTLFGWYVFASMFVSGITVIALVSIYLKAKGYLTFVNDSHLHDLAKFMFGISIFWTYLWFSQFMLIWYANIPEEAVYFAYRIENYTLPFWGMVAMNFVFPLLILMNSDFKRVNWFIVIAGIVILLGHYMDVFNMVMPATVGDQWFIGFMEIGAILFFMGLFINVVFRRLTRAPLLAKGDPFIEESRHYHY